MTSPIERRLRRLEAKAKAATVIEAIVIVARDRVEAERELARIRGDDDSLRPTIIVTGVPRSRPAEAEKTIQ